MGCHQYAAVACGRHPNYDRRLLRFSPESAQFYQKDTVQINQTLTNEMVERGIAECAEAHFVGDARRVRKALVRGQCEHCRCIANSLVRQIGEYLGQVDNRVRAVYRYQAARPPETPLAGISLPDLQTGIHLIVWVERKSPALSALAESLKIDLTASRRALGCARAAADCYTLDIEMVDDRDAREQRGFGLLINHPYLHAERVWNRPGEPQPATVEEAAIADRARFAMPDTFDPELIPESRLIDHALKIERLPPQDRAALEHHLTELKVTLIRRIVSDHLRYIDIAKQWFTVADLADIYRHRIGFGRIGGKSAGMLLAGRIINQVAGEALKAAIRIPESFFLGADLMYIFMSMNGLMHWSDQKYKPEDQIRAEYPGLRQEFTAGEFPPEVLVELRAMLEQIGPQPIIVRSSSQLEDNLGTSFAGKYDSQFCPNRGAPQENLQALTRAIAATYASTFKPDALLYRRSRGLEDYDERMSVLIQPVQGEAFGRYYLPFGAGVAFSHNLYRWSPQIRREDGFVRLVWGLGTRAVERVGDDYPRLVALSHPTLQPDDAPEAIRHYSQRYVDLIDLEENTLKTLAIEQVLAPQYPPIRWLAQVEQDGYFITPRLRLTQSDIPRLAITFDHMLQRTPFASLMSQALRLLEQHYRCAVDVEFTLQIADPSAASPEVKIALLQCRPQSSLEATGKAELPEDLSAEDIVFSSRFMVPQGYLTDIRHVIFVDAEKYSALPTVAARNAVGRAVGRLNAALEKKTFICVGPGRWGTANTDLGVFVGYADICHAAALIELSGRGLGSGPEPSLGTHFFQDLMEAQIYPLALPLDAPDTIFNRDFFYHTPNRAAEFLGETSNPDDCVRLIEVASFKPGHHLELIMDDEQGQAVAFLAHDTIAA